MGIRSGYFIVWTTGLSSILCCTIPDSTQMQICALLMSHEPNVRLRFIDVDNRKMEMTAVFMRWHFCSSLCWR